MLNPLGTPPLTSWENLQGRRATHILLALYLIGAAGLSCLAAIAMMRSLFFFGGGTLLDLAMVQGVIFSLLVGPLATWALAHRYGWQVVAPSGLAIIAVVFVGGLAQRAGSCDGDCVFGSALLGLVACSASAVAAAAFMTGPVPWMAARLFGRRNR